MVAEMQQWGALNVSGALTVIRLPTPADFRDLRRTPAAVRKELERLGRSNVVAFQTRNPMHRAHEELTKRAIAAIDGVLLLQPAVGMTRPGDVDHYTRVRTYKALTEKYYPADRVLLSLIPLAMRLAGPREALWHAIIRRNYGASHFIVGRDHAGPGKDSAGRPFFGPYDAQELVAAHADEIGVRMVPFKEMVFLPDEDRYEEADRVAPGVRTLAISGTQVRDEYLARGRELPAWFTRPETAAILAEMSPPRHRQGFCVWFTGLSGAGKSATADVVAALLSERGRRVTVLDGDVIRTHLSKGLGFSREDRDAHILRVGFVASEIVRHGGAVICAAISPYRATRSRCRTLVGGDHFLEVFVDTPLALCERRDTKGLYAKARRGEITGFTGIDDPYEPPEAPELVLKTEDSAAETNAQRVIAELSARGFVLGN
jgi:sulfate adenylyltransferase